jgi:hypothetical protein
MFPCPAEQWSLWLSGVPQSGAHFDGFRRNFGTSLLSCCRLSKLSLGTLGGNILSAVCKEVLASWPRMCSGLKLIRVSFDHGTGGVKPIGHQTHGQIPQGEPKHYGEFQLPAVAPAPLFLFGFFEDDPCVVRRRRLFMLATWCGGGSASGGGGWWRKWSSIVDRCWDHCFGAAAPTWWCISTNKIGIMWGRKWRDMNIVHSTAIVEMNRRRECQQTILFRYSDIH